LIGITTAPRCHLSPNGGARRQQVLDHPQAGRTTDREPDGLPDDVGS